MDEACIRSIACRNRALLTGSCGYVAVEDRTTGGFAFRPEDRIPVERGNGPGRFRQRDDVADLVLKQSFEAVGDHIEWGVEVSTGCPEIREIHLHFVIPVFGAASHGFTAHAACPLVPGRGDDHLMVVYGPNMFNEECFHCSVLPMVSTYDPEADVGLVIVQPVEVAKPRMEYFFIREQPALSLVVRWTHLRLQPGKPTVARMVLAPIRGCWRDALRFVHDLYPDHFRVHEPSVFDHEGPMACGELIPEDTVDRLAGELDLGWQEIHANVFERYGDYAPRTATWHNWAAQGRLADFDLPRLSRTGFRDMHSAITDGEPREMSRQGMNDYVAMLHRKGVGAYLYTNPVILDLDHLSDFPGSLAESAEGTPMFRDYYRNAPMHPAPDTGWGQYLMEMTERMLDLFPGIDGLFLDELHWNQFDFAHDDGVSARRDRPVSMIGFAVQDAARRICAAAHRRGKAVWANGPTTLEVVHHVDGFMAEASREWLGSVLYLGMEKPLVLLIPAHWSAQEVEEGLKSALWAGAQPGIMGLQGFDFQGTAVWGRYRHLFAMLRGRRWILEPHAVSTHSPGLRTNCFALPDGDIAVVVVRDTESDYLMVSADGYALREEATARGTRGPAEITVRWPNAATATSARLFSAADPEREINLEPDVEADGIRMAIPGVDAAVIRIGRQGRG